MEIYLLAGLALGLAFACLVVPLLVWAAGPARRR